jgi:hypothetical protein
MEENQKCELSVALSNLPDTFEEFIKMSKDGDILWAVLGVLGGGVCAECGRVKCAKNQSDDVNDNQLRQIFDVATCKNSKCPGMFFPLFYFL